MKPNTCSRTWTVIREYINNKFGQDVTSQVALNKVTPTQNTCVPKASIPKRKEAPPPAIRAKGREVRCAKLRIQPCDGNALKNNWKKLEAMGLTFPK